MPPRMRKELSKAAALPIADMTNGDATRTLFMEMTGPAQWISLDASRRSPFTESASAPAALSTLTSLRMSSSCMIKSLGSSPCTGGFLLSLRVITSPGPLTAVIPAKSRARSSSVRSSPKAPSPCVRLSS